MNLSGLHIYPVKSAAGVALQSASLEPRGLNLDRRWMVVDASGVFISQRTFPRMALVSVRIGPELLELSAAGKETLSVPIRSTSKEKLTVKVWDDEVLAESAGDEAERWFSGFLGTLCRLVFMPDESRRIVESGRSDIVSFADAFPLLIISQASLDDLNARLGRPVAMNRFRPNIVISGSAPYAEDSWKEIKIGKVHLRLTKKCDRCVTTTVDQTTGIAGKEPLATLSKYRRFGERVFFGRNAVPEKSGLLAIGDRIEVVA